MDTLQDKTETNNATPCTLKETLDNSTLSSTITSPIEKSTSPTLVENLKEGNDNKDGLLGISTTNATITTNINNNNNNSNNSNNNKDEDIIPTAIVIKNIPFAIKKEQLLEYIGNLNLPLPYAFNYHFDNGVFRGLAFANFATIEETNAVVSSLNGKEIGGRKLRVEYKKLLPQAERDRIEREKREKRGQLEEQHRSISNLSLSSMISQQQQPLHNNTINKNINTINNNNNNNNNTNGNASNGTNSNAYSSNGLSLQNINNFITGHTTLNSINNNTAGIINQPLSAQPTNMSNYSNTIPMSLNNNNSTTSTTNTTATQNMNNNMNANNPTRNLERFYAPLPSTTNMPLPPQHLDFNDPDILEIYSQLLIFKDREKYYGELAYPQGLTANHKRVINVICSFLCLYEVYDPEFIIIRRSEQPQQPLWFNSHFMLTQQQNQQQNQHQQHQQQQQQQVNSSTGFSLQPSLQPNSTGGSISKSHSYTSLLQAQHYAAAANTSMGATSLYQDSNSPPQIYQTISNIPNGNMDIINKLQRPPSANANIVSGTTSSIINPSMMQPGRIPSNTANSNNILLNNNLNSSSLTNSPNTITVATSNTNTLSNPLLRNHKATPPSMHTMPVTPSMSRTPFYPVNNSSQQQQTQQGNANGITNTPSQLLPQNTNGSVHSTYSTQSYYEPSGNSLYTSLSMSNLLGSQAMGHSNSFQQILNNITSSTPANDYPTTGVNVMSSSAGLQSSSMQFTAGHSIGGHINNSNNTLSNANDKINDNDTNDDNDNDDDDDDYDDDDDDDDDDDNGNDTNIEFDMTKGLSGLEL